jgi:hypothetical protein
MKNKHQYLLFCILLLIAFPCCTYLGQSNATNISKAEHSTSPTNKSDLQQINHTFSDEDKLSYKGYDVVRLKKRVKYEYPDEKRAQKFKLIDITYAVVNKNNRNIYTFGDFYCGLGNATNFGLFSLLGGESKQLIISQTIPRGGRHWVVSLFSNFKVLFDSQDYGVGREEFYVIDIDKDGIYEISLPVTSFYEYSDVIATGNTPLPDILFKYDETKSKYLPANKLFQEYALRGIEQKITKLNSSDELKYRADVMDIILQYVYAGKEEEGWLFYEREYKLNDKERLRTRIRKTLKEEAVYKQMYIQK